MTILAQIAIRTRKLGVLIRDARLAAHKTIPELAKLAGTTEAILQGWEEGQLAPSLPELEVLAFTLGLPMEHFWSRETRSEGASPLEKVDLTALVALRQRLVGALLRKTRENASLSLSALSEQSGVDVSVLESYEMGDQPIPVPELEALMALLDGRIASLFDQTGPIGQWMHSQKAVQSFLELPPDLRAFVAKPVNRPYLELAVKLSEMSTDKLRAVAETLLDITY